MLLCLKGCQKVEIAHTDHWRDGNTGQYFYFSEQQFDQLVGKKYWTNEKFDVVQKGSQLWHGKIIVWKGAKISGAHGRRDSGSAVGQWVSGDTIELQTCQGMKGYQVFTRVDWDHYWTTNLLISSFQ